MPTYVAFLRAINLGAKRRFAKEAIIAATEEAGGSDVDTYLATGNVRLTHASRSASAVTKALEKAYADAAGFDVPTIVFTTRELADLTSRAEELHREHQPAGQHYVTLYDEAPPAAAVTAAEGLGHDGEVCVVDGRAAHALLEGGIHSSRLLASKEFKALGQGTARTVAVLRTVTGKWA